MVKKFDRNIFIMMISIMVGVVIITFFIADIMARSSEEEKLTQQFTEEKKVIEEKNLNFTSAFLDSLSSLDLSREFKSDGDIKYAIAKSFYTNALTLTNSSKLDEYKNEIIDNCELAKLYFHDSSQNFNKSIERFTLSKNFTNYPIYNNLVNLYINLSKSGHNVSLIKYDACNYLIEIANNLNIVNGSINKSMDLENLMDLLNSTEYLMYLEEGLYDGYRSEISDYELMEKIR